jgi:hypothetical protein
MAGGAYEVFYKNFDFIDYKVVIDYRYDSRLTLKSVAESDINLALLPYKNPTKRIPTIKENLFYNLVDDLNIPSLNVLNITLIQDDVEIPYLDVNVSSIGKLSIVELNGTDIAE